jgi:GWxTD domain-containing protein
MHCRKIALLVCLLSVSAYAQKDKKLRRELQPAYEKWPNEDVAYIITGEERKAFSELGTDDEREQFVEQFWLRRDPTPDTAENEYKEEHYRRIAWANERFASGMPGWQTDRGRMYIRFGPPDEVESHPSGGSRQRPVQQGGGQTTTFPFETWRYRYLANVGSDVVIEFVDPTLTGEYRLSFDPCEKDVLRHLPASSQPPSADPAGCSVLKDGTQFEALRIQADIERPPVVKFKDLEAFVNSRVSFATLPMAVHVDYVRLTEATVMAYVTVQFEIADKTTVNLFGRVSTLARRPVTTFEKPLEILSGSRGIYREAIPLAPGRYRLNLIAKDTVSGNMAASELTLEVPRISPESLGASSLILADLIEPLPAKSVGAGMFDIGDRRVRPRVGGHFTSSEKAGFYLRIYGSAQDRATITYELDKAGSAGHALAWTETVDKLPNVVAQMLRLSDFTPGAYTMRIKIATNKGESIQKEANLIIDPQPGMKQ